MDAPAGFGGDEFAGRIRAAQAAMAKAGLDALWLTTEADLRYFTGFLTRFWESPTWPWFLVLPAAGDPVAVIPAIGAALMARTGVRDIRTWQSPDYEDDGVTLLADTLAEVVPKGGRVGVPMGRETQLRMPLADFERIRAALPERALVDAGPLLRRLQEVKSPGEIAAIRAICAIAGRAFDRVPGLAVPGVPLSRVFRAFQMALLEEGADWVPYIAGGAGPGGYSDVISPAGDAPLMAGDLLMLDTGAMRAGYFCDFDRNWAIGHATAPVRYAHRVLHDVTTVGFEAVRPGAVAADLHAAMVHAIRGAGWRSAGGRLGHGLGMQLTEPPSLIPADDTVLRPGMVLTLEPTVDLGDGRMMVHEENIVVTEAGAEWLSARSPREVPVIGGKG